MCAETGQDSLQLTLGVIEAAVHHTVRKLLSGSSVGSTGSHRNLPIFSLYERDTDEGRLEGENRIFLVFIYISTRKSVCLHAFGHLSNHFDPYK